MRKFFCSDLTKEELSNYLKEKNIPDAVVSKLAFEEIDGTDFLELTKEDINDFKFKVGHRKKLEKLLKTYKVRNRCSIIFHFPNTREGTKKESVKPNQNKNKFCTFYIVSFSSSKC